jgi:hypothetical protein
VGPTSVLLRDPLSLRDCSTANERKGVVGHDQATGTIAVQGVAIACGGRG